jgi:hypothetical protein
MLRAFIRIVVATLLVVLACAVFYRYVYLAHRHGVPSLAISHDRIDSVIAAARGGDCLAAVRLSHHYTEKRDLRAAWTWMQRAKRFGCSGAGHDLEIMRGTFPPEMTKDDGGATP